MNLPHVKTSSMELQDGKKYILDAGYTNGGEVILINHGKHFCLVRDPENGAEWSTMVYRLSEIHTNEKTDKAV